MRVTTRLGKDFVCGICKKQVDGLVELVEELCEEVETVRGFCYLEDRKCKWWLQGSCDSKSKN